MGVGVGVKVGGDVYRHVHSNFYISGQPAAEDRSEQEKEEHSHLEPSGTLRTCISILCTMPPPLYRMYSDAVSLVCFMYIGGTKRHPEITYECKTSL